LHAAFMSMYGDGAEIGPIEEVIVVATHSKTRRAVRRLRRLARRRREAEIRMRRASA